MNEFVLRREKLVKELKDDSLLVLYSGPLYHKTADQNLPFAVNRNFYYLVGLEQDDIYYVYDGKTRKESLYIFENTIDYVKWNGEKLKPSEASKISGIKDIHYLKDFFSDFTKLLKSHKTLYLDFDPHYQDERFFEVYKLRDLAKDNEVLNIYLNIVHLRMIKSPEEIKKHLEAIKATKEALEYTMANIHDGLYEYQAEAMFNYHLRFNHNFPNSFDTIAASGINGSTLHYIYNSKVMKDGELLLLDLGCQKDNYISDISRCYPVNGKFSPRQRELYEAVLRTNKACFKMLKPGVTWREYNEFAYNTLFEEMKKLGLVKKPEELKNYYWHSVGHLIGLDTHDVTDRELPLMAGMALTIEPGIYIKEEGIGIRIEDNVLITETGCEWLSKDIIREVDEIEAYMKEHNKYVK